MLTVTEIQNVTPIEYEDSRVLTTQQLAEFYETSTEVLNRNFNRNKDRYQEGKHYFRLTGDKLTDWKTNCPSVAARTSVLLLWTKQGCFRHAKSLNTEVAWDVFDLLESNYFEPKTQVPPMSELEILAASAKALVEHEKKLKAHDRELASLTSDVSLIKKTLTKPKEYSEADWSSIEEDLTAGYTISKVADKLGFKSAQELNKKLVERGIQDKNLNGSYRLCEPYTNAGYVKYKLVPVETHHHGIENQVQLRWTDKGVRFIRNLFNC